MPRIACVPERVIANQNRNGNQNHEFEIDNSQNQSPLRRRFSFVASTIVLLTICALAAIGVRLDAQVRFGTIVGNVVDVKDAAVVGANVTLTNLGTNEKRNLQTGSGGLYTFPNLDPGRYRVDISQTGFKTFTEQDIQVEVDVTTRIDAALQVGSPTETVQVEADAIRLQTDSSSLGSVVSQQTVENMPVSGRDVNNLMTLVPGVSAGGSTYGTTSGDQLGGARTNSIAFGNYFIGGAFGNQSAFFVDGVSSNGPANNVNGLIPSQDVVQEFRVVTNNVSAEYGNYAGGVINITTKSGTNKFHGSLYDYVRNGIFNANDFFANLDGTPRPPLVQNQFGGTIGGPVKHNKTFFFFGYEGLRSSSTELNLSTVPTQAELSGDFSAAGLPPIYDHTTGTVDPSTGQIDPTTYQQFSYNGKLNVIPPGRINGTAKLLLADQYPASGPNTGVLYDASCNCNFIANEAIGGDQNQYNARVDQNFGSKDVLFARYTYWKVISLPFDAWGTHTDGQGYTGLFSTDAVLGNTYTINPTTLIDVRASYVRIFQNEAPETTGSNYSKYGSNWGAIQPFLIGGASHGGGSIPQVSLTQTPGNQYTAITSSNGIGGSELYWLQNMLGLSGSLIKTVGKHQIKVGASLRHVQWIQEKDTTSASLTYDYQYTGIQAAGAVSGGDALASNLLGIPQSGAVGNLAEGVDFFNTYGFFGEDTYQITRKLTATLGLRWDQPTVYSEAHNNDTVFLPNKAAPVGPVSSYTNPITNTSEQVMGLLTLTASPAWPSRREDYLHWHLFAPRIGLAYRLNNQMAVRAGYGLSYLPNTLSQDQSQFSAIASGNTSINNTFAVTPGNVDHIADTTDNPFPTPIILPPGRSANFATFYGISVANRVPGDKASYQQQWNLAVERQLGSSGTVSVAYAGSKGTHLLLQGFATGSSINDNQLSDQYLALGATALATQVPNPFYGQITSPSALPQLTGPTVNEGFLLRPFPQYNRVIAKDPHRGFSSYNSLQVALNKRIWDGGQVVAAYTWSKLMSNTDNITSFLDPTFIFGGQIQDNDSVTKTEKSLSAFDTAQNLSFGYVIALPFGKDRQFGQNMSPVANVVAGGWSLHGLTTLRSGQPIGMVAFESPILSQYGGGGGFVFAPGLFIRPDVVPGCNKKVSGSRYQRALHGWYNGACFYGDPNPLAFGNESRIDGGIRIDSLQNWDMAASKDTSIKEGMKLNLSIQAYNIFNRAQFGGPGAIAFLPNNVTASAGPPRNLEFAVRVTF